MSKKNKNILIFLFSLLGLFLLYKGITGYFQSPDLSLTKELQKVVVAAGGLMFFLAFTLRKTKEADIAFSSNLLGAMIGGFLEYLSLVYGIKNLCLIALAVYFLSYIFYFKKIPSHPKI